MREKNGEDQYSFSGPQYYNFGGHRDIEGVKRNSTLLSITST